MDKILVDRDLLTRTLTALECYRESGLLVSSTVVETVDDLREMLTQQEYEWQDEDPPC